MELAIEVHQLERRYRDKRALDRISFTVKRGEVFGFLGPSGSGKTTTVKILTNQLIPSAGEATVLNRRMAGKREPDLLSRIGIMTDNSGIYERLTVLDNLELFRGLYAAPHGAVTETLESVGLSDEAKTPVQQLSKGMKQRVVLARALLHKPDLLFLDEPTSALDPMNTALIHNTLRALNRQGTTIFLTTHDMMEAEALCDRVAFLNNGTITALDTPEKLKRQYADRTITVTTPEGRHVVNNDSASADRISQWMRSGQLLSIHSNEPTLGDIFVRLTGRKLS
ncbi:ABC transporter ATP-binding protein [Cohnella sp.]|uniref:ABC transporter ATP-binding protein n=1 Tax=Cohnella sp. TaxID=1883426 RepID=UPI003569A17E